MTSNKSLLIEYNKFIPNVDSINEAIKYNRPIRVTGVLQRAGAKNQNGRVYPKPTLMREAQKYEQLIKENLSSKRYDSVKMFRVELREMNNELSFGQALEELNNGKKPISSHIL